MRNICRAIASAALALMLSVGCGAAETVTFKAELKPVEGVAPGTGHGNLVAVYDTETRNLSWKGTVSGLSGNVIAAHFHGPADPGQNAVVLIPVAGVKIGNFEGSATLTNNQGKILTSEKTYFMVHTAANPGGEVRGHVVKGR